MNDDPETPAELFARNYVATLADDDRVMMLRMLRAGVDLGALCGVARAVQIRRCLEDWETKTKGLSWDTICDRGQELAEGQTRVGPFHYSPGELGRACPVPGCEIASPHTHAPFQGVGKKKI